MGMPPLLRVRDVARDFTTKTGTMRALRPLSLDLPEGEFLSIVGPSGCGKTTLLRIIAGLLPPTEGKVMIEGREITGPTPSMGIVYQRPVLLPWRTVLANVLLAAEIQPGVHDGARERARALLQEVGLSGFEHSYPAQLSGGMQQRVALCRALLTDPKLLLMDEPFAALDAITRERMGLLLHRLLRGAHKTVVFITHAIAEAVFLSHEVIVMTARPGAIGKRVRIDLPEARDLDVLGQPRFAEQAQEIRQAVLQYSDEV
jgi:NitT/TauT family transport system ATP-binding protein